MNEEMYNVQEEVFEISSGENLKVKLDTIIRLVLLCITLVNMVLALFGRGVLPFTENEIYAILTVISTIIMTAWSAWKNNSVTTPALQADEVLTALKGIE